MNGNREISRRSIDPATSAWVTAVVFFIPLLLSSFTVVSAAEPEIIRVRVPAKDLSKWFPPGTELRILSPQEFDARVSDAGRARSDGDGLRSPRLVRARHYARWQAGILSGRTDLVIDAPRSGEFVLERWTPAVPPSKVTGAVLGAHDTGTAVLQVEALRGGGDHRSMGAGGHDRSPPTVGSRSSFRSITHRH